LTVGILVLVGSVLSVWFLVFHRRHADESETSGVEATTTLSPITPADWEHEENFEHDFLNPMTLRPGELDGLGDESDAFENENEITFE
jgi:hypothetical protein